MITGKDKRALDDFRKLCEDIERATPVTPNESPAVRLHRIELAKKDYGFFFAQYLTNYAKAPSAKFHIDFANEVKVNPVIRAIFEGHRGSAKSTHVDIGIPLWLMINNETRCVMLAGETEDKAKRLLSGIQAQLQFNKRFINDFGDQTVFGDWNDGEFTTKSGVTFFAIGLGQSPNGTRKNENRPDLIICDDLDSRMRCKNPRRVDEAVDWVLEDLMGCFDIGRARFILCNSRIAKYSILSQLHKKMVLQKSEAERWHYIRINAIDKRGNPTWPEKYTREYWRKIRKGTTVRAWQANYMNNPITEGKIFKEKWIKWIKSLPLQEYDALVVYGDPSYKNTPGSDYKAISFWGKRGRELHKLGAFVRQCSMSTFVKYYYDLHETIPEGVTVEYYMEKVLLQDLLMDEFTVEGDMRGYQLPIRGDDRKKDDKFSRIENTSPLYERGFIFYDEKLKGDPDMETAIEHLLAFEKGSGAPDDSPDADEGAIYILQKRGRQEQFTPRTGSRTPSTKGY